MTGGNFFYEDTIMNFKDIPKIDLHCHLDGSLPIPFIQKEIGIDDEKETLKLAQISGNDCSSLTDYLMRFDITKSCLANTSQIKEAAYQFMLQLQTDNLMYIECRFSPAILSGNELTSRDILESVIAGIAKGSQKTRIYGCRSLCYGKYR